MNIKNICDAIDKYDINQKRNIFRYAILEDLVELNKYAIKLSGHNGLVDFYADKVFIGYEKDPFYCKQFDIKNTSFEQLMNDWNENSLPVCKKRIEEFAEISKRNYQDYMDFGNSVLQYIESIEFLKIPFQHEYRCLSSGFMLFRVNAISNQYYVEKKIELPMFTEFKDFDKEKCLNEIKNDIFRQIKSQILKKFSINKKKKLSLDDKFHLVHIAAETVDFVLASNLNEHRSKLPKHLKEILIGLITAQQLIKVT